MFLHSFSQHVSALPWANFRLITFFLCKANHTISKAMLLLSVDNNNIALLIVWFGLQRKKVINLKMACGRAETCHCNNNNLVIKTLNKLCLTIIDLYILCFYSTQRGMSRLKGSFELTVPGASASTYSYN